MDAAAPDPARACYRKVRYSEEATAVRCAARILREHHTVLRAYGCELCGGWHLTHSARDEVKVAFRPGLRPAKRSARDEARDRKNRSGRRRRGGRR